MGVHSSILTYSEGIMEGKIRSFFRKDKEFWEKLQFKGEILGGLLTPQSRKEMDFLLEYTPM